MKYEWSSFTGSLVGFLAGAGLVFVLMQSASNSDSADSEGANLALAEALEQVSLQVAAMKKEGLAAATSDQVRIERTSHPSSSARDINQRLQSLESALLQLTEVLGDVARSSSANGTSSIPLVALGAPVRWEGLEALRNKEEVDITLQHFGWSFQKVLNTYGSPTGIYDTDRGVRWDYDDDQAEVPYYFSFRYGAVTQVTIYE